MQVDDLARLADVSDERGALLASLAEREAELADVERARKTLGNELGVLERRAEGLERDRAALGTRLDDRDTELRRAIAARERADEARRTEITERERLAELLDNEIRRREAEHAAHAAGVEDLRERLDAVRTEAAALAVRNPYLEAQLEAERERTRDLGARHEILTSERDAAREHTSELDARLERARHAEHESRRSMELIRRSALTLHAHAARLDAELRAAGFDATDTGPLPTIPVLDGPAPDERPTP